MPTEQTKAQDRLFKEAKAIFGQDVIIVFKPETLDYHVTMTSMKPVQTKGVLTGIVGRY